MTITTRQDSAIVYGSVRPGEVFKYGLRYGIKIRPLLDEDETEVDAIDLADGSHLYISACEKVVRVEAELIIT